MAKNPAFPFYAQDYLVDTMRWTREAKSLHIDLLCESWTNGALSDNNGAPYGLGEDDLKTWQKIKHKWLLIESDGFFWVNQKLEECRKSRKFFLERQIENGKKGGRPAKNNPEETQAFLKIKPKQNPLEEEKEKEEIKEKEGAETKTLEEPIVSEIVREFRRVFPKYPMEQIKDSHASFQIACKIAEEKDYSTVLMFSDGREYVLKRWGEIVKFIATDKWFSKRSLDQINKEWQSLIQSINSNGKIKQNNSKNGTTGTGIIFDRP